MGKFNFISGGYYGKLGNTVGQRWKNQRIVHEYFIPANPRTEIQQDNRERFVDITGATQLALQLNGGSRLWDSLTNTAFNNRQAEAARYAEQGGGGFSYVPVIPYGYESPHYFEPIPAYEEGVLTWTSTDTSHLAGRQMAIALRLQNRSNSRYENMIFRALISGSAGAWTFSVTVPSTHRLSAETWQIGVNCDDGEEELETIYVAPLSLANLKQKIALTLNSLSVTWDNTTSTYSGTISTSPLIDGDATPLLNASLSGILLGEQSTQSTVIQTRNSAGGLSFTFTPNKDTLNQRILFPSGSTCVIPAATFQSSDKIYITQPTTLNFSAALETQNWSVVPLTATQSADNKIAVSAPIAGASSVSGTMGFSLTSYDSALSAQSVAASLSGTVVANAIAFQTSAAVAQIVNKDAQTVALTSRPSFVKNGVTYQLNSAQTVTMAAAATTFTISTTAANLTVNSSAKTLAFAFTTSAPLPAALSWAPTLTLYGVLQAEYVTQTYSQTASVGSNVLNFTVSPSLDAYNQFIRFPSTGSGAANPCTVNLPSASIMVSGYTYNIAGNTFTISESSIPTQSYKIVVLTATQSADNKISVSAPITGASSVSGTMGFSLTSYDSALSAQSVAASLSGTVAANAIAFQTSAAVAQIVNKDAQTVTLTSRPSFVKNGVTYQLNAAQTVSIAAGATSFSISATAANLTVNSTAKTLSFAFTTSAALPSAFSWSPTLTLYGVLQAAYVTQSYSSAASVGSSVLNFTVTPSLDAYNQFIRFPSTGSGAANPCTVNLPSATVTVSGYTYNIAGNTFTISESNIPAQVLANAYTTSIEEGVYIIDFIPPTGSSNWTAGKIYGYVLTSNDAEQMTVNKVELSPSISQGNYIYHEYGIDISLFILGKDGAAYIDVDTAPTCLSNGITYNLISAGGNYVNNMGWVSAEEEFYGRYVASTNRIRIAANLKLNFQDVILSQLSYNIPDGTRATLYYNNYSSSKSGTKPSAWDINAISILSEQTITIDLYIYSQDMIDVISQSNSFQIPSATLSLRIQAVDVTGTPLIDCTVQFTGINGVL